MRKCCSEGRFSDCSQEAPKEPKETWPYLFARNRWLPGSSDNCEVRFRLETGSSTEVWSCYLLETGGSQGAGIIVRCGSGWKRRAPQKFDRVYLLKTADSKAA